MCRVETGELETRVRTLASSVPSFARAVLSTCGHILQGPPPQPPHPFSSEEGSDITLAASPTLLYPTESREKISEQRTGKLSSPRGKISTWNSETYVPSLNMCCFLGKLCTELRGHPLMAPSRLNCWVMPSACAGPSRHPFLHSCVLPL